MHRDKYSSGINAIQGALYWWDACSTVMYLQSTWKLIFFCNAIAVRFSTRLHKLYLCRAKLTNTLNFSRLKNKTKKIKKLQMETRIIIFSNFYNVDKKYIIFQVRQLSQSNLKGTAWKNCSFGYAAFAKRPQ